MSPKRAILGVGAGEVKSIMHDTKSSTNDSLEYSEGFLLQIIGFNCLDHHPSSRLMKKGDIMSSDPWPTRQKQSIFSSIGSSTGDCDDIGKDHESSGPYSREDLQSA